MNIGRTGSVAKGFLLYLLTLTIGLPDETTIWANRSLSVKAIKKF